MGDAAQLKGCSRAVTIPEYDIVKTITPNDNVIEFTPEKSGEVRIACTMNMFTGALTVK